MRAVSAVGPRRPVAIVTTVLVFPGSTALHACSNLNCDLERSPRRCGCSLPLLNWTAV